MRVLRPILKKSHSTTSFSLSHYRSFGTARKIPLHRVYGVYEYGGSRNMMACSAVRSFGRPCPLAWSHAYFALPCPYTLLMTNCSGFDFSFDNFLVSPSFKVVASPLLPPEIHLMLQPWLVSSMLCIRITLRPMILLARFLCHIFIPPSWSYATGVSPVKFEVDVPGVC
jgi:hypothetical protein